MSERSSLCAAARRLAGRVCPAPDAPRCAADLLLPRPSGGRKARPAAP